MSVNIKQNGELVKVANNISIVQADWNDRNNTNKNTCIKNQPDTIKTMADLIGCQDENALAGALMVKEGISEVKSEIPTKTSQLTNDKGFKSSSEVVSNYDDIMANTVSGYVPDALAVKEGFQEINDSLSRDYRFKTYAHVAHLGFSASFDDVPDLITIVNRLPARSILEFSIYGANKDILFEKGIIPINSTGTIKIINVEGRGRIEFYPENGPSGSFYMRYIANCSGTMDNMSVWYRYAGEKITED